MKDPHLRRRRRSRGPLPLGGARLLGLSLALAPLAARAAPCSPVVNLLGDPGLVTRVGQALRQRGISLGQGAPGCPVLRASVSATSDDTPRLRVTTIEEVQRTEHVVVDSGTAATLIESWARRDLSAPLLTALLAPPRDLPPAPPPPSGPAPRYLVGALFETAVSSQPNAWFGASAHACARLGRVCFGALARGAAELAQTRSGQTVRRSGADVLATLSAPLALSPRWRLLPSAGLGAGFTATTVVSPSINDQAGNGGLRAALQLLLGVRLLRDLSLDLGLSASAAFLQQNHVHVPVLFSSDDGRRVDGEPWGYLRGALGLSYGRP